MHAEIRKIGPAEAEELLLLNHRNRHLRSGHIARLADDMINGAWRDGGAILIADDGESQLLLDGQHRLHAIIRSGCVIELIVITGLSPADQEAVDTGIRRGLSDVLSLAGEKNASTLAAAIGWHWRRSRGLYRSSAIPTVAQGLAELREYPGLRECLDVPRRACRTLRVAGGLAACLYFEQLALDAESANFFWETLATGLVPNQNAEHPIHLLRVKLDENAKAAYKRLDVVAQAALIIKAWNAFIEGREIKMLKWTRGGANPEAFPEMIGPEV